MPWKRGELQISARAAPARFRFFHITHPQMLPRSSRIEVKQHNRMADIRDPGFRSRRQLLRRRKRKQAAGGQRRRKKYFRVMRKDAFLLLARTNHSTL